MPVPCASQFNRVSYGGRDAVRIAAMTPYTRACEENSENDRACCATPLASMAGLLAVPLLLLHIVVALGARLAPTPPCESRLVLQRVLPDFTWSQADLLYDGIADVCDGQLVLDSSLAACSRVRVHALIRRVRVVPSDFASPNSDAEMTVFSFHSARANSCVYRTTPRSMNDGSYAMTHEIVLTDTNPIPKLSPARRSISAKAEAVGAPKRRGISIWAWLAPLIVLILLGLCLACFLWQWCAKRRNSGENNGIQSDYGGRRISQTWIPAMSHRLSQSFLDCVPILRQLQPQLQLNHMHHHHLHHRRRHTRRWHHQKGTLVGRRRKWERMRSSRQS